MDKGKYRKSSNYDKVEALLLCWKEECNDLENTEEEVTRLKLVLENKFRYHATIEHLDSNVEGRLQVKLNYLVARFVEAHDGPNTLLIVYYGGHGKPGQLQGELQLLGSVKKKISRPVIQLIFLGKHLRTIEASALIVCSGTRRRKY